MVRLEELQSGSQIRGLAPKPHIGLKQLWEYMASYLYLPRLKDRAVLQTCVEDALKDLFGEHFAYADRWDEDTKKYIGLRFGGQGGSSFVFDGHSVLVQPDVAQAQKQPIEVCDGGGDSKPPDGDEGGDPPDGGGSGGVGAGPDPKERKVVRFHASADLDPSRVGRDAGVIAEEIIQHLETLRKSTVRVTLDIEADVPDGVPDNIQRIVTENADSLKFRSHGFESE